MSLPKYAEEVLQKLRDKEWHSYAELRLISPWFMSLITVLRKQGHVIERKRVEEKTSLSQGFKYRLVQEKTQ